MLGPDGFGGNRSKIIETKTDKTLDAQSFDDQEAEAWIETNDLPNAHRTLRNPIPEDITLSMRN